MSDLFLIASLFVPRWSLLIAYFNGAIPLNSVPFYGDVLMSIFVPRILILIYIYGTLGTDSNWFWIHLIVAVLAYLFGGSNATSSSD